MTPTPKEIVKRLTNQAAGAESGGPGHHWTAPNLLREAASIIESQQEAIRAARSQALEEAAKEVDGMPEWPEYPVAPRHIISEAASRIRALKDTTP